MVIFILWDENFPWKRFLFALFRLFCQYLFFAHIFIILIEIANKSMRIQQRENINPIGLSMLCAAITAPDSPIFSDVIVHWWLFNLKSVCVLYESAREWIIHKTTWEIIFGYWKLWKKRKVWNVRYLEARAVSTTNRIKKELFGT